jgi:hypothetical protein
MTISHHWPASLPSVSAGLAPWTVAGISADPHPRPARHDALRRIRADLGRRPSRQPLSAAPDRGRAQAGKLSLPVAQEQRLGGMASGLYAEPGRNMKRPIFSAMPVATFTIAVTVTISAAPLVHAQTDVESACRSSGGQYSSEEVQPHWGAAPILIETCCTGTGASGKCVTYRDGVQGPTYGGG